MLERLFKLSENKTSARTEALAGMQVADLHARDCARAILPSLCAAEWASATTIRLPQAPVPARAKVFLLSDALGVGKPESARCSTDKQPRRRAPKRMHSLGCA